MNALPFDVVTLRNGSAQARVSLYGAHVLSLVLGGHEVLFLSSKAVYERGKAIRGGIPLIWPQFSNRGPLASHGFARVSDWHVKSQSEARVVLALEDTEATRKLWPYAFVAHYTVELLQDSLRLEFQVMPKSQALTFTFALHTYFAVPDIGATRVHGLQGAAFQDHLKAMQQGSEDRSAVSFESEVDRTYINVPRELSVSVGDASLVQLRTSASLSDAVVWNPWIDKSSKMADFGPDEYKRMVCVEVGAVTTPVTVQPGSTWDAWHVITKPPPPSSIKAAI